MCRFELFICTVSKSEPSKTPFAGSPTLNLLASCATRLSGASSIKKNIHPRLAAMAHPVVNSNSAAGQVTSKETASSTSDEISTPSMNVACWNGTAIPFTLR